MKINELDAKQLALDLLRRSKCQVQVACVLTDNKGRIFSWGWNHPGPDGFGTHAEEHAINRANLKRIKGSTATIAGKRNKNSVYSRPCMERCYDLLKNLGVENIEYSLPDKNWKVERIK